jgi:hypothetical protein
MKQGLVLPASGLVISAVINGPLFLDYVNWSLVHTPDLWAPLNTATVGSLTGGAQSWVHRPGSWILMNLFGLTSLGFHNVLGLVLDARAGFIRFSCITVFRKSSRRDRPTN